MKIPCFLFVGGDDPRVSNVETCAKLMPNATFLSIPGLDHAQTIVRSDLILPHVEKFLQAVSKNEARS